VWEVYSKYLNPKLIYPYSMVHIYFAKKKTAMSSTVGDLFRSPSGNGAIAKVWKMEKVYTKKERMEKTMRRSWE